MVLVQKWPFLQIFFLGNIGQVNVFYDILERKNAFPGYKKKEVQKVEKLTFFKRHGFGPKTTILSTFFLGNIGQESVSYEILERKNAFLVIKRRSSNWHFSKGVNQWFLSKNGHFSNFLFLGNIALDNVFHDILEQKNAFLGYKKKQFK